MARVILLVEGVTEEDFVSQVLAPHLYDRGYEEVSVRKLGLGEKRGGIIGWPEARRDILRHLAQDRSWLVTTMVDYYGLPQGDARGWPGRAGATRQAVARRAATVQAAMHAEIVAQMGTSFDASRFLPFVVLHKFEALLFSDCTGFAQALYAPKLAVALQEIRDAFATPEEINDSPQTAPSKRVEALMPEYQKPLFGSFAAEYIGLGTIRAECPHFRAWLEALEAWPH